MTGYTKFRLTTYTILLTLGAGAEDLALSFARKLDAVPGSLEWLVEYQLWFRGVWMVGVGIIGIAVLYTLSKHISEHSFYELWESYKKIWVEIYLGRVIPNIPTFFIISLFLNFMGVFYLLDSGILEEGLLNVLLEAGKYNLGFVGWFLAICFVRELVDRIVRFGPRVNVSIREED